MRVKVKAAKTPDGLEQAVRIKVPGERKVEGSGEAKVEGRITVAIEHVTKPAHVPVQAAILQRYCRVMRRRKM